MSAWSVSVSPSVWVAIREQVNHIAKDSLRNALAWEARLDRAIFGLAGPPISAVDSAATDRVGTTIHRFVFERTYLIFYELDHAAAVVYVVGFRHGARQPGPGEP